jgi:prepilin-type N-terminal cleavage/methylation domain-containing protein
MTLHPRSFSRRFPFRRSQRLGAFTLIELLIVMALILILFVMYFNPNSKSYQQRKLNACEKNLQNLYIALDLYARSNDERYPAVEGAATSDEPLGLLVPGYIAQTSAFICPGSGDSVPAHGKPVTGKRISYAYYMGRAPKPPSKEPLITDEQVNTGSKASGSLLFSADGKGAGNNHRRFGGNVLRVDGSIQWLSATSAVPLSFPNTVRLLNPR